MVLVCNTMVNEGIASGVLHVLNAVWLSYDCGTNTFHIYARAGEHLRVHWRFRHAHKRNFLPQLKCSRLGNKRWQGNCSNVYGTVSSDIVHSCADDFRWGTALQSEVMSTLLSSKFPSSSMQGKIWRQRNPLFSSKFPSSSMQGKIRRQRNPLLSTKFPAEI
jgi:hypothetical protein